MMLVPIVGLLPWRVGVSVSFGELHDRRMRWCQEELGPNIVPAVGFVWRLPRPLVPRDRHDLDVWCFRERAGAVVFDMVWG